MRNANTKLIAITIAIAVVAVIGSSWTPAQSAAESDITQMVLATDPMGFVRGQTLRFSVVNPIPREQGGEPVRAQMRLYDALGNVLERSQEVELPPGEFRSFDFNRDHLELTGEPGTGRLQVRGEITCRFNASPVQIPLDQLPTAMELVDNSTGRTMGTYQSGSAGWVKISPD